MYTKPMISRVKHPWYVQEVGGDGFPRNRAGQQLCARERLRKYSSQPCDRSEAELPLKIRLLEAKVVEVEAVLCGRASWTPRSEDLESLCTVLPEVLCNRGSLTSARRVAVGTRCFILSGAFSFSPYFYFVVSVLFSGFPSSCFLFFFFSPLFSCSLYLAVLVFALRFCRTRS